MPLWLHFKPKQVGKCQDRENKNYRSVSFRSVPTSRVIENSKIKAKKFKKLKYTIMSSFQDKIGWKRQRKRKNKDYRSVPFLHDA